MLTKQWITKNTPAQYIYAFVRAKKLELLVKKSLFKRGGGSTSNKKFFSKFFHNISLLKSPGSL